MRANRRGAVRTARSGLVEGTGAPHVRAGAVFFGVVNSHGMIPSPAGRMFFQITGAFAEFERAMIRSRVRAGLDRAKARGVRQGRPRTGAKVEAAIRARLVAGEGVVALGLQRGPELDAGLEEGAGLADGFERAVQLRRAGAPAVAEHAVVLAAQPGHPGADRVAGQHGSWP